MVKSLLQRLESQRVYLYHGSYLWWHIGTNLYFPLAKVIKLTVKFLKSPQGICWSLNQIEYSMLQHKYGVLSHKYLTLLFLLLLKAPLHSPHKKKNPNNFFSSLKQVCVLFNWKAWMVAKSPSRRYGSHGTNLSFQTKYLLPGDLAYVMLQIFQQLTPLGYCTPKIVTFQF